MFADFKGGKKIFVNPLMRMNGGEYSKQWRKSKSTLGVGEWRLVRLNVLDSYTQILYFAKTGCETIDGFSNTLEQLNGKLYLLRSLNFS